MFDLSAVRAAAIPAARPPTDVSDSAVTQLAGREVRFAAPGIPPVRLPRDRQSSENIWKMISEPPTGRADPVWQSAVWTALTTPEARIPLTPSQTGGRDFALAAAVSYSDRTPVLAIVKVSLERARSKFAPGGVAAASACVVSDVDLMAEQMEGLFVAALPQARSAAKRAAARAMWLGGSDAIATVEGAWRTRVEAMGAALGLRIEIIEEPARHTCQVRANLGSGDHPAFLLVWQSMSRGAERLVDSFGHMCPDGEVVYLEEASFPDTLIEARLALIQRGLAEPPTLTRPGRQLPQEGQERFYVKIGGSKTGDILVDVADCGHGQWGSDVRRNAPRALMGVERLEGTRPATLFLCAKCSKHRWRARF